RSPRRTQRTQKINWIWFWVTSVSSVSSVVKHFVLVAVAAVLGVAATGCRQDMHDQPKYQPLERSTFFLDQQASRSPVAGTVPRGQLHEDTFLYTGKIDGSYAFFFPFRFDETVMAREQERLNLYCSP